MTVWAESDLSEYEFDYGARVYYLVAGDANVAAYPRDAGVFCFSLPQGVIQGDF